MNDFIKKTYLLHFQNNFFFRFLDFTQKPNAGEMKVTLSNKHKINTKWIYLGASLTVFCVAVAVAVGVILLDRNNSKGNTNFIPLILI